MYVCGVFQGPKDIPETVAQASGAAAAASAILSEVRGTEVTRKEYPEPKDVKKEEPRIGVFVCRCGNNIGGVVNVPSVKEYANSLGNVVYADENLYTCSQDTQEKIKKAIEEHKLNRVVVASCSPRTHEPLFQETIREAGLNRYLFEMANIRDQCSWVHMHEKEEATDKARDLVRMAVANARLIRPLEELTKSVTKKGLVVGGGLAGMAAALGLADQGFETFLVEKEEELGGNLRHIQNTLDGKNVQEYPGEMRQRVTESSPRSRCSPNAVIADFSGYVGNFKTSILVGPQDVYPGIGARGDRDRHRRPGAETQGVFIRRGPAGAHPAGAGKDAGGGREKSCGAQGSGHDPVRGVAERGAALLQPGLLRFGGEERPEDQVPEPQGPGQGSLPGYADVRASGRTLRPGAACRGSVPPLRGGPQTGCESEGRESGALLLQPRLAGGHDLAPRSSGPFRRDPSFRYRGIVQNAQVFPERPTGSSWKRT